MARTRSEIKTLVGSFTGRAVEKATLIESLCDEALQVAVTNHPFKDATTFDSDTVIVEDTTEVDVSAITGLRHVITATIVETDGSANLPLVMKNETWWHLNVINAEDNSKGWPQFGLRRGTDILLDRPADSNLTLRLVVATDQVFANDSAECPIAVADVFVTQYATAMVFLSVEEIEKYKYWYNIAMGYQFVLNGKLGGTLQSIIDLDRRDRANVQGFEPPAPAGGHGGISVENLITGHDDYGGVKLWHSR